MDFGGEGTFGAELAADDEGHAGQGGLGTHRAGQGGGLLGAVPVDGAHDDETGGPCGGLGDQGVDGDAGSEVGDLPSLFLQGELEEQQVPGVRVRGDGAQNRVGRALRGLVTHVHDRLSSRHRKGPRSLRSGRSSGACPALIESPEGVAALGAFGSASGSRLRASGLPHG